MTVPIPATDWHAGALEAATCPTVVVCWPQAERNVTALAGLAGSHGVQLVPHVKGHKAPQLLRRQLAAGAAGAEIGKPSELLVWAAAHPDVAWTLAWAWDSPPAWEAAAQVAAAGVALAVDVDCVSSAAGLNAAAARLGTSLRVRVQVDTGVRGAAASQVLGLGRFVADASSLELAAVTTYRSLYLPGCPDERIERDRRPASVVGAKEAELLLELTDGLRVERPGLDVICGSSTTSAGAMTVAGVTHVVAGNYALSDLGLVALGVAAPASPAVAVLCTVLERTASGAVVDAGTDLLGQHDPYPGLARFPQAASADGTLTVLSCERNRSLLAVAPQRTLRAGQRVLLFPGRACRVAAAPGSYVVVDDTGSRAGCWERLATVVPAVIDAATLI